MHVDGKKVSNNYINIKDSTLGYYPAFSLSSGKEIQVKFGGIYKLDLFSETGNHIDEKPICQYNNLENIVSCYMKIIDKSLIKIINNEQILYIDSIRFFYPMLNFFANIAFNDEYIMKKYILRFMYQNYFNNKDIYKHFDERFNFLYLIINIIEKNKQQNSVLFLLDCLCEDIKNDSYIFEPNEKMENIFINIKLYNYLLKNNLIKEILILNGQINDLVFKKIKEQLFIIFQAIKICGNSYEDNNIDNLRKEIKSKVVKFNNKKTYAELFSELIETLLGLKLKNEKKSIDKINVLITELKSENKQINENLENKAENKKRITIGILKKYFFGQEEDGEISVNEENKLIFVKNRKLENNPYRKIFLDLIKENFEYKSDFNYYNFISTIFLPLLNLFNKYFEKDNLLNYSSQNTLSYIPLLGNNKHYLNCKISRLFISESYQINEKKMMNLNQIINIKQLRDELYEKQYNISSYLIGLMISLSSFFERELYDFDFYLKNIEYKKWKDESDDFKINNYIENMKKLIYSNNETNINIIKRALECLIPYFSELLNNNFYLFLPYKIINLLKFFIKFLAYHFFFFSDDKILKNEMFTKLIQLFTNLNLKLFYDKNTTNEFTFNILDNIKFLYNMFLLIKQKHISISINGSSDDLDTSENEDIKDFRYFLEDKDLENILKLIELNFEEGDNVTQKYFYKFLFYFKPNKLFKNNCENNIFIPLILKNMVSGNNNFWFKTFIIDTFVKKKLIKKIHKINDILNIEEEGFLSKYEEKLIKHFISITKNLSFISYFIDKEEILKKYFKFYLDEKSGNINSASSDNNIIEKEEKDNLSIYYYLIDLASLIIKNLLNSNFFQFFQAIRKHKNIEDFKVKYLLVECFSFLEKVIIEIPENYQEMLLENEEENVELNKDLKNYFIYLMQNISVNDISKLSSLLSENVDIMEKEYDSLNNKLRKFIIFLNKIENDYNLIQKNSSKKTTQDKNECPICLDKESDSHVIPCGHMFCFDCIQKLNDRKCPLCRTIISGVKEHPEFHFAENNINIINNINNEIIEIIRIIRARRFQNDNP